jgi:hypothetical protein
MKQEDSKLDTCLAYSSDLKAEEVRSSETSVVSY